MLALRRRTCGGGAGWPGGFLALTTNAIYGGRARPGLRALRQRLLATLTDRAY